MSKARPVYIADADQPLIAIPAEIDGRGVILYFADAASAAESISDEDIQAAMGAIGSFADLDWDDFVEELERTRRARAVSRVHETAPVRIDRQSLVADLDEPLIALVVEENGREVTRYFADEAEFRAFVTAEQRQAALNAIGSFSDLDWDEMISELERIRHENDPTPIFEP